MGSFFGRNKIVTHSSVLWGPNSTFFFDLWSLFIRVPSLSILTLIDQKKKGEINLWYKNNAINYFLFISLFNTMYYFIIIINSPSWPFISTLLNSYLSKNMKVKRSSFSWCKTKVFVIIIFFIVKIALTLVCKCGLVH